MTPEQFAVSVLKGLGIKPSRGAVQAMVGWQKAEGGHWNNDARHNPLNTTQPEPGAGNTGTQGNIKVYTDWGQGVKATVTTLKNGRYQPILDALAQGNPSGVAQAIGQTPWGTGGGLVARTIAGTKVGEIPAGYGSQAEPQAEPAVDNSAARGAAVYDYLQQKGNDPLTLALSLRGLQDQAGGGASASGSQPPASVRGASKYASRADAIDAKRLPYQWGGGHGAKVDPYNAQPLDCSGAVSAVLGIDPRVSGDLASWGKPGRGKRVTIYANGHHTLLEIDGHFFGTSASNPGGGAGWIPREKIGAQYLKGFVARHPPGD